MTDYNKRILHQTINLFIYTATGFTIMHGLLAILILLNPQLYRHISLHYSDSLTWYFIFFFVPVLAGVCLYLGFRNKDIPQRLKIFLGICMILQIGFTISASLLNLRYWGYAFKRPTVFNEILLAEKILTCSRISNTTSTGVKSLYTVTDTSNALEHLYGRQDLYYGTSDRIFMTLQDRAHMNGNLYEFSQILKHPEDQISLAALRSMDKQIQESGLIDQGETGWDTSGQLHGFVTEFITENRVKYIFAGLKGGQVANDHFPVYEFLFAKNNQQILLTKKQRFYTDVAGIEGFEYANLAPFFSLLITIMGLAGITFSFITIKIIKSRKVLNPRNE
jgi:hypothetical protein